MRKTYFIEKSFGPIGSPSGMLLFGVGIITSFSSIYALFLVFSGAFIGFTSQSTIIDFDNNRIKSSNNLFGIFRIGKWIKVDSNLKISIKKANRVWRGYSLSNRILDITREAYTVNLYDADQKIILPLMKVNSIDIARAESEILRQKLGLK